MDALEAIHTRRSVARCGERRPPPEEVLALLEAAVRAPNHLLTEPWRFIVLTGGVLDELGEVMAERVRREFAGARDLESRLERERARPRRAPVIVTVVYVPAQNPRALEADDRYAVGAAIQNILLAAHATGMAAYVRSGPAVSDPGVRSFLGVGGGEEIAGFVYLGYPEESLPAPTRRTPAADRTSWRGWD